ncbi:MAG: SOS mutagenesis and repair protein UmuC [Flavobacteriales bacterium]|jgi:DNA polymerase V|nr:SOS mutagenesis and repair protein UmuC [Flavobacteriales bacterium]|tara:strand:+ start:46149 stop:47399 length:1251 start_codon:yes stop_codon:yes gene_type:complete
MIGLLDCNNFYASCEQVFNPKLKHKPIIVLSNNDGCVIARSNEAKELGVKMGEPLFKIKNLIFTKKITVFSTNFILYGDLSKRVMSTLKSEVKNLEIYSIDEAFLDFSEFINLNRAIRLKRKVKKWTGIPVSIGIGPTKTLAKVANHIAKKKTVEGVCILDNQDLIKNILSVFPVENLWGVGEKFANHLKYANINNALELKNANPKWIKKIFGINGIKLQKELNGEICYKLETAKKRKNQMCTSRSFDREINDFDNLQKAISNFASNCAFKLRCEKSCCSKLSLFLTTNRFKSNNEQYFPSITLNFDTPTNDSIEIVNTATKALKMIYRENINYKKAGVIVHNITPQENVQMSLFDNIDRKKRNRLMHSIDKINLIMGREKVQLASQGTNKKWAFKSNLLSPCYTTRFSDILTIKI